MNEPEVRYRIYYSEGKATWYTDPILSEEDARSEFEAYRQSPKCSDVRLIKETTTFEQITPPPANHP